MGRMMRLKEVYLYNAKTDKLHIKGYCRFTKGIVSEYIPFETEDEALAYDGRAISMCKLCLAEREKRMKSNGEFQQMRNVQTPIKAKAL